MHKAQSLPFYTVYQSDKTRPHGDNAERLFAHGFAMLHLFVSNRYEVLRGQLLDDLAAAPPSPFATQEVVIASSAVKRDLRLAIATQQGICAGMDFPYLAQWLWARFGELVPVQPVSPFSPARLAWRLYRIFGDTGFVSTQPRLGHYLAAADPVMRLELAQQVASLFEQYITYRPEWLAAWSAGQSAGLARASDLQQQDELWQAALWRRITAEMGTSRQHPSAAFLARIAAMAPSELRAIGFPERAFLFALPTLPPLYLRILEQLSAYMEIRLYLLNPCEEYWFEIVDQKRLSYLRQRGKADYHDAGNPLLAAWGKQTQALFDLLLEEGTPTALEEGEFVENPAPHLLAQVQNAILHLEPFEPGSLALAGEGLADRSLEVHVCHSLTRELEVLHDQLLALLEPRQPDTLGVAPFAPSEILVVLPDLETAAPLIDAVFGTANKLPYIITGRSEQRINPVAAALLAILDAASGRLTVTAVFGLLRHRLIAEKLRLSEEDVERIHTWLMEAGVHWASDAEHRASFDLPPETRHTWRDGLARLLLGYALPEGVESFNQHAPSSTPSHARPLAPAGYAEGSAAQGLGALWRLLERLDELRHLLHAEQSAADWLEHLQGVLERDLAIDYRTVEDARTVQSALRELGQHMNEGLQAPASETAEATSNPNPIPASVVIHALKATLDSSTRGGVPTGAVTFTALPSLRLLPYRMVCLLGMNDGAFPGLNRPAEFDLLPLEHRRGDRQRRLDDRNLFLDLLLAARDRFYISYTGRSQRDDSPAPPSVLVSELLDAVLRGLNSAESVVKRARLEVTHPLQAFSLSYFAEARRDDPRKVSFEQSLCHALQQKFAKAGKAAATNPASLAAGESDLVFETGEADEKTDLGNAPLPPLFTQPLPAPEPVWRSVSLAQLLEFYRHPARYLLQRRLGLRLGVDSEVLSDEEPFLLDWQGRHVLAERVLPAALAGASENALRDMACAGQEVPAGPLGSAQAVQESAELHQFADKIAHDCQQATLEPLRVSLSMILEGEPWHFQAELHDVRLQGLVGYRYDDTRPADYLRAWLHHLCLCAAAPPGVTRETRWHSRDGSFVLLPLGTEAAQACLTDLIRHYRLGLMQPLHLPLKTAWAWCTRRAQAGSIWQGNPPMLQGELNAAFDPCWRLALRGQNDPLPHDLPEIAPRLFSPLSQVLVDERVNWMLD